MEGTFEIEGLNYAMYEGLKELDERKRKQFDNEVHQCVWTALEKMNVTPQSIHIRIGAGVISAVLLRYTAGMYPNLLDADWTFRVYVTVRTPSRTSQQIRRALQTYAQSPRAFVSAVRLYQTMFDKIVDQVKVTLVNPATATKPTVSGSSFHDYQSASFVEERKEPSQLTQQRSVGNLSRQRSRTSIREEEDERPIRSSATRRSQREEYQGSSHQDPVEPIEAEEEEPVTYRSERSEVRSRRASPPRDRERSYRSTTRREERYEDEWDERDSIVDEEDGDYYEEDRREVSRTSSRRPTRRVREEPGVYSVGNRSRARESIREEEEELPRRGRSPQRSREVRRTQTSRTYYDDEDVEEDPDAYSSEYEEERYTSSRREPSYASTRGYERREIDRHVVDDRPIHRGRSYRGEIVRDNSIRDIGGFSGRREFYVKVTECVPPSY